MAFKLCINYIKLIVFIFIIEIILLNNYVHSARQRMKPPLIEETQRRRTAKSNVCHFGNQTFNVNDQWRPNLGPPIGTLFCVHCECVAIKRKHRKETVARVRCKNIKDECPKTNCDNPILLPDACCKTCPSENKNDEIAIKMIKNKSELEMKIKANDKHMNKNEKSVNDDDKDDKDDKDTTNPLTSYLNDDTNDLNQQKFNENIIRKCVYENIVYDEASQWRSLFNDCEMCSCQRGKVKCEPIICPLLNCTKTIIVKGQCCPSCSVVTIENDNTLSTENVTKTACEFAGRKSYVPGSKWHPYLPPFGFDRCTICTCTENIKVKCSRSDCPPLACPEHDAYRENDMDCCKRCPDVVVKEIDKNALGDQRATFTSWKKSSKELLSEGGCKQKGRVFANGDDWHPHIHPIGEYKCVRCNCKDRHITCKRLECPKLDCPVKIFGANQCCPRCQEKSDTNDKSLLISTKKNRRRKNRRKEHYSEHHDIIE